MDIVIIALSRWDGKYSSTILSLAKVFARRNRVFYIDNPFTLREAIGRIFSVQIKRRFNALFMGGSPYSTPYAELPGFITMTPPLTFPINWLPEGRLFNFFSYLNDRIVYRATRKMMLDYSIQDFVYINSFNPLYGNHFGREFNPKLYIYHCVDDISRSPYVSRHGTRLEKLAIRRATLVITTSSELERQKSKESAKKVFTIYNAANVALFQQAVDHPLKVPEEIQQIPVNKKLITYMGNICHRLDYDLLLAISDTLHDHVLLMVGPASSNYYRKSGLVDRPNVIFTGPKKLEELPAYLKYSHCCIIPFLCNTLTRSIYPLKINEYLSAGKPVVSTPFSDEIVGFSGVVEIARDPEDFVGKIKAAIAQDNLFLKQERVTFSSANSWENRADAFLGIVNSYQNAG